MPFDKLRERLMVDAELVEAATCQSGDVAPALWPSYTVPL
jgi:hypothetical protein